MSIKRNIFQRPATLAVVAMLCSGPVIGQTSPAPTAAPGAAGPRTESEYARELLHLRQIDLMDAQLAASKGTPAENLWKSQLLQARFDELTKDSANTPGVTRDYLAALTAFLKNPGEVPDGRWALDHAQFILAHISQPVLTRMEYFSSSARDRQILLPQALLAEELLRAGAASLDVSVKRLELAKPFDEAAYNRVFGAAGEVRYYAAWSAYFHAMALDAGDVHRKQLLGQAIEALAEWAVETPDNGVNYQSLLLRGKAESEAGDTAAALADFVKAQSDKAPAWVQFQARYQTVVAQMRTGDFRGAQGALETLRKSLPADSTDAQLSADMLAYRVAWAAAEAKPNAADRRRGESDALDILSRVMTRDARYRDLVYDQLAAQLPDSADVSALFPIQQLALARVTTLRQRGDTPESRQALSQALRAVEAAAANPQANNPEKLEALFLQGVCQALLGNTADAARLEVEFAEKAPKDVRTRQVVDLALEQIGQLRRGTTAPAQEAQKLRDLAARALDISIKTLGDTKWLYLQGRLFEETSRSSEAAAVYAKITPEDRNYLDARYRMVALATEHFSTLEGKAPKAQQQAAADELFSACGKFVDLLDHPPASAPQETLQAAQGYRYNIWLIEAVTALSPAVGKTDIALDRLARLDAAKETLAPGQRGMVLRYRMQALQLAGKFDEARQARDAYIKSDPQAMASLGQLMIATADQIDKTTDAAEVKRLAEMAVMLEDAIIAASLAEGKKDNAFIYQVDQVEMMSRAGRFADAQTLALTLQKEKPEDLRPYLAEARSIFAQARAANDAKLFSKSQDYFTRLLGRMATGSDGYWEAWLRVIQSMEAQNGSAADIKKSLGDLKAVYGSEFGGTRWRKEFDALAVKYRLN